MLTACWGCLPCIATVSHVSPRPDTCCITLCAMYGIRQNFFDLSYAAPLMVYSSVWHSGLTSAGLESQRLLDGLPSLADSAGEVGVARAEPLPDSPLISLVVNFDFARRNCSAAPEERPADRDSSEGCNQECVHPVKHLLRQCCTISARRHVVTDSQSPCSDPWWVVCYHLRQAACRSVCGMHSINCITLPDVQKLETTFLG